MDDYWFASKQPLGVIQIENETETVKHAKLVLLRRQQTGLTKIFMITKKCL